MRVLHVTDSFLPRCGGIEYQVRDLTTRQRAAGIDARVLTSTPSTPAEMADPPWVVRVPGVRASSVQRGLGVADLEHIRRELPATDVLHCHLSIVSPFALAVARCAVSRQIPTVITVHSMWNYPLLGRWTTAMVGQVDAVRWSAVSAAAAEQVARALGPDSYVAVTPNAVAPEDWASPLRMPLGPPVFVSVMRFARRKRPLALARMLRSVADGVPSDSDLKVVIVGDGPQRPRLERYLARHHMTDWVRLTGHLDRPAIRHELAQSSLFIAPAVLESFGIAALEARCAGLPVIANSRGGVGTFITDGADGVLVDNDDEMVKEMIRFVLDAQHRQALSDQAKIRPTDVGWDAAIRRSLELYLDAGAEAISTTRPRAQTRSGRSDGKKVA